MTIPDEAVEAGKQALWQTGDLYDQAGGELSEHPPTSSDI